MRPTRLAAIALAVLLLVLATATPGAGETDAGPRTIASYCSPSGDVCYGIFKRSGKVSLEITTAARRVNYARQYPLTFAGSYRVTWKLAGSALGPALRFSFRFPRAA